jgi:predicted phage terminase large subunit-like protein
VSTALLDDLSLEQQVALLSEEEQEAILADLDIDALPWDWNWAARPSQQLPMEEYGTGSDWVMALINAGRGYGKTRTGAEYVRELDQRWHTLGRDPGQDLRIALLGRTAADVRDTILNGESGLLNIFPPSERDKVEWISSQRRVNLPNGGFCLCFSAEEPDQLRGPQFHFGWGDEMAAYKQIKGEGNLDAWTNLRIAVRLGLMPQVLGTTTPKRVKILRELIAEIKANPDTMILRTGRTTDNVHLAEAYLNTLFALYGNTTLGAQELDGQMLDAVAGATVDIGPIDDNRVTGIPNPQGTRWIRVISVDPSVAEKPRDLCGITVVYAPLTYPVLKRQAYVVDDLSIKGSPTIWGDRVIKAAIQHRAAIIVENNQGGALVRRMLQERAAARNVEPPPIREVWASKGKQIRAENIGAAYQRGRVHHVNVLPDLEDQLTSWTPDDKGYSPDRLDSVVHALSAVLFPEALIKGGVPGSTVSHSPVGGPPIARQSSVIARRLSALTVDTSRGLQRRPGGLVVPGGALSGMAVPRRIVSAGGKPL